MNISDLNKYSDNFIRFKKSYFDSPPRDGADIEVLSLLSEKEKALAVDMLISQNGHYIAQALGELNSLKAIPFLVERLSESTIRTKIDIAVALWKLDKRTDYESNIINIISKKFFVSENDKVYAIISLAEIPTNKSIKILLDMLNNKSSAIRTSACRALMIICGCTDKIDSLCDALLIKNKSERSTVISNIKNIVEK